jgi:hypothetical protein
MYIANNNHRLLIGESSAASRHQFVSPVRHETLWQWVENLLAGEHFDAAAADDIRDAVASKIQIRVQAGRQQ